MLLWALHTTVTWLLISIVLVGLGLAFLRWTESLVVAKVSGSIAVVLLFFFVEHFVGLGSMKWLFPVAVGLSGWSIMKHRHLLSNLWKDEIAFQIFALYFIFWRLSYPNIEPARPESLTNLSFITAYMSGVRLPPADYWFASQPLNCYYTFAHYGASVLGRMFHMSNGMALNYALIVVSALTAFSAYGAFRACALSRKTSVIASSLGVLFAGTGAGWLSYGMFKDWNVWHQFRFLGGSLTDAPLTKMGELLRPILTFPNSTQALQLPCEPFSYLAFLSDYHAPLAGFALLALCILCFFQVLHQPKDALSLWTLGALAPLTLITNPWNLPLQGILLLVLLSELIRHHKNWRLSVPILTGGLSCTVLIYPFLAYYIPSVAQISTKFTSVPLDQLSPPLGWILVFLPTLITLLLLIRCKGLNSLNSILALVWILLLVASEFIFVDDVYSGEFQRFNSTLKWWPWIMMGVTLTCVPLILKHGSVWLRRCLWALLILNATYIIDIVLTFKTWHRADVAIMHGEQWLRRNYANASLLDHLKALPNGIALQRVKKGSFTDSPALALFANKPLILGWREHQKLWRPRSYNFDRLHGEMELFYQGELTQSLDWLLKHDVSYVLWTSDEAKSLSEGKRLLIDLQIHPAFLWKELDKGVGLWIRR